jgi:RNA polymerase sigma factor (sigma-70 family)
MREDSRLRSTETIEPAVARMIERLRAGDPEAWSEFIAGYRKLIYSAIHRANARFNAGWDDPVMEDLFEETLWKLLRNRGRALASWRGGCRLETWIYRIVRNVCVDHLRRESRRSGGPELDEERAAAEGARSARPDDADLRLSLDQAIDRLLSPREALAVRLVYFEGLTYREVAEKLGMTVGAMSGLVYRALGKLRRKGDLAGPRGVEE